MAHICDGVKRGISESERIGRPGSLALRSPGRDEANQILHPSDRVSWWAQAALVVSASVSCRVMYDGKRGLKMKTISLNSGIVLNLRCWSLPIVKEGVQDVQDVQVDEQVKCGENKLENGKVFKVLKMLMVLNYFV